MTRMKTQRQVELILADCKIVVIRGLFFMSKKCKEWGMGCQEKGNLLHICSHDLLNEQWFIKGASRLLSPPQVRLSSFSLRWTILYLLGLWPTVNKELTSWEKMYPEPSPVLNTSQNWHREDSEGTRWWMYPSVCYWSYIPNRMLPEWHAGRGNQSTYTMSFHMKIGNLCLSFRSVQCKYQKLH